MVWFNKIMAYTATCSCDHRFGQLLQVMMLHVPPRHKSDLMFWQEEGGG